LPHLALEFNLGVTLKFVVYNQQKAIDRLENMCYNLTTIISIAGYKGLSRG
jgi:hypothetical protein